MNTIVGINEKEAQQIAVLKIGGIYEHYKSSPAKKMAYKILTLARHSETEDLLVIYTALYDCGNYGQTWARPLAMFLEEIEVADKKVPRFKFVEELELEQS